jgi:type II secretory pathway pseudopilin PulG
MCLQKKKKRLTQTRGFTLIEGLAVLFIASVIIVAFLNVFSQGSTWLLESKKKTIAVAIANEKMEMLRNLAYENVGVSGSIPTGVISGEEFLERSGTSYRIVTDIRYRDDPYDGTLGGTPNDMLNVDQKQATITVLWGEENSSQKIRLSALFVPSGIESLSGAGTLSINVIDSSGSGIGFASVRIVHPEKGIDFFTTTNSNGNILLPGAPESLDQKYEITISKSGYETVSTFPPYPISDFDPIDEHASVLEGGLANKVIISDFSANPIVQTVNSRGESVGDVLLTISGGRIVGSRGTYPTAIPVFNYEENVATDTSGIYEMNAVSPGTYDVLLRGDSASAYTLAYLESSGDVAGNAFSVSPGESSNILAVVASVSEQSLLVSVVNDADDSPIANAEVQLKRELSGYDEMIVSQNSGRVLFPSSGMDLQEDETYEVFVSAEGFLGYSGTVTIEDFTEKEVRMFPN